MKIVIGFTGWLFVMSFLLISSGVFMIGKLFLELGRGVLWLSDEITDVAVALTTWIETHCVVTK